MAVENIVTAMAKNSAMSQLPPGLVGALRERISSAGIRLPPNSMLNPASSVIEGRGSMPGSYGISVNTTRFTCRSRGARPSSELRAAAIGWCTTLGIARGHIDFDSLKVLVAGIKINGRPYAIGSHCEIGMPVSRYNPGLAGDASTFKVATVHKFYTLQISGSETLFVELSTHREIDRFKDIRIVKKKPKPQRRTLSVDSIRGRVKFVAHWDAEITKRVCVLRMWNAV